MVLFPATHIHGIPFVKQLTNGTHGLKDTVGSHEVKSLIFERPANKLQRLLDVQGMSKCLYCRSSFIDTSGKTQQTTGTEVLIAQIIAELTLFQLIQFVHFDDCIQCDLTIKELIRPQAAQALVVRSFFFFFFFLNLYANVQLAKRDIVT